MIQSSAAAQGNGKFAGLSPF